MVGLHFIRGRGRLHSYQWVWCLSGCSQTIVFYFKTKFRNINFISGNDGWTISTEVMLCDGRETTVIYGHCRWCILTWTCFFRMLQVVAGKAWLPMQPLHAGRVLGWPSSTGGWSIPSFGLLEGICRYISLEICVYTHKLAEIWTYT